MSFGFARGGTILTTRKNNVLVNVKGDARLADFGLAIITYDKTSTSHEDPTARGHSTL